MSLVWFTTTADSASTYEITHAHAGVFRDQRAKEAFEKALQLAVELDFDEPAREPILVNLGHTMRRLEYFLKNVYGPSSYIFYRLLEDARWCFEEALSMSPKSASNYSALGFVFQLMNQLDNAIQMYHEALSLKPQDGFATEMLNRAMQEALQDQDDLFWGKVVEPAPSKYEHLASIEKSPSRFSDQEDDEEDRSPAVSPSPLTPIRRVTRQTLRQQSFGSTESDDDMELDSSPS